MPRKKVKNNHKQKQNHTRLFLVIFLIAVCFVAFLFYFKYHLKHQQQPIPDILTHSIQHTDGTDKYAIDIQSPEINYPENPGQEEKINNELRQLVTAKIDEFRQEVKNSYPGIPETIASNLTIRYKVFLTTPKFISILFSIENFQAGAAHPNNYFLSFNYDLVQDKEITLADVFSPNANYVEFLSNYTATDLRGQFMHNEDTYDDFITQGTAPHEENFQVFVLTPKALEIIFNPATIAPYAAGMQKVVIPYETLQSQNLLNASMSN